MKLQVFYDYICPFCKKAHPYLQEILADYPDIEIDWRPCEAHPRPERYGMHSDLCVRGYYYAIDHGVDAEQYHQRIYDGIFSSPCNVEDPQVLAGLLTGLVDADDFIKALADGAYADKPDENNTLVWETYEFAAVPSLVLDGQKLCAVANVGLSRKMIEDFIKKATGK